MCICTHVDVPPKTLDFGCFEANGARYTGQWSEGRFHDEGYLQLADGTTFA